MLGGHSAERAAFLAYLEAELKRDANAIAVARIDLDRFSRIRQTWGSAIARTVRAVLNARIEEIVGDPAAVLRYGEDAFIAVVHVHDHSLLGLKAIGMEIVDEISAPIPMPDGAVIAVGTNVGLAAAVMFDSVDPLRLITGAELAIQRANNMGSRRAVVYEVAPVSDPTRLPQLYADMLDAIREDQFQPVYQPIVELPSRRVHGAETLVRWMHPTHGTIMPSEFIGEAESSGLIRDLDTSVRHIAMSMWVDRLHAEDLTLSLNLSAADLDAPNLMHDIRETLDRSGLAPERVLFEITETALTQDWPQARERLAALKEIGVRLGVDDFGSGHMFLDRLATGLFDLLKIDRSIVAPQPGQEESTHALLGAVASMAQSLNMDVTAEGVETEAQLARVIEAGCNFGQGYLFARPLSPDAFANLITADHPL